MSANSDFFNKQMRKARNHQWGTCNVDPGMLSPPYPNTQYRETDPVHVQEGLEEIKHNNTFALPYPFLICIVGTPEEITEFNAIWLLDEKARTAISPANSLNDL